MRARSQIKPGTTGRSRPPSSTTRAHDRAEDHRHAAAAPTPNPPGIPPAIEDPRAHGARHRCGSRPQFHLPRRSRWVGPLRRASRLRMSPADGPAPPGCLDERDKTGLEGSAMRGFVYVGLTAAGPRRRGPEADPIDGDRRDSGRICQTPTPPPATARARGRKQYATTPIGASPGTDKFERMLEFGTALARIRNRVKADLDAPVASTPGCTTVLATIVRLLDTTLVRVGNEEYARSNRSFGLTTLRTRHAAVQGSQLRLRFRGKSGIEHEVALEDPRVARRPPLSGHAGPGAVPVRGRGRCPRAVDSADVNDYIPRRPARTSRPRTSALARDGACARPLGDNARRAVVPSHREPTAREVAKRLGNTVAVCRGRMSIRACWRCWRRSPITTGWPACRRRVARVWGRPNAACSRS